MRHTLRGTVTLSLALLAISACASSPAPRELLDARASYADAQSGPAGQLVPAQVHVAKVALDRAELSFDRGESPERTADLAYVAGRQAELAESQARLMLAEQQKEQARREGEQQKAMEHQKMAGDLQRATQQLDSTRQEVASQQQALLSQQQQLDAERAARAEAEKRTREAIRSLEEIATVKEEARGMVISLSGAVLFVTAKADLLPIARSKLDQVAAVLKDQPDQKIIVEGHTDSVGTPASNQALSEKRAQSVRDYLVSRGVPAEAIQAVGFGPDRPVADNKTAEGRADNRRVEIVVKPAKE